MTDQPKKKTGFAAISRERHREIASKGGKAAHEQGTAHEFTTETATDAARKGGLALATERGSEYMREIGRRGVAKRIANAAIAAGAVDKEVP